MLNRPFVQVALWLACATMPSLAQCTFPAGDAGRILIYTFDPTVTDTGTVLHVTFKFRGGQGIQEAVEVPTEWVGETLHGVTNLRALSERTVIADATAPGNKTRRYLPNQDVVLAYDVVKDWTGRFRHPAEFHGAVMRDYIELNGDNALVHPKLQGDAKVTVRFDWSRLPSAWVLATSFGVGSNSDERCQAYSGAWSAVQYALFAAGTFRIHHFRIGTQAAVFAIRDQTFSDEEAITHIQKAVGAVRDFWHDNNFPYFLVTLKQFDNDSGSGDGSAFTNAFWLYLSRKDSISDQIPVLIHETFHEWDPRRMGPSSASGDWEAIEWFREGFVTYYGYLLALRSGLIQLPAYLENVNRDLSC